MLKIIVALAVRFAKDIKPPKEEETVENLSDALSGHVDREQFITIITALVKCQQFDLSKPYPAADVVNRRLLELGLKERSRETIVKVLKPIKDARETPAV